MFTQSLIQEWSGRVFWYAYYDAICNWSIHVTHLSLIVHGTSFILREKTATRSTIALHDQSAQVRLHADEQKEHSNLPAQSTDTSLHQSATLSLSLSLSTTDTQDIVRLMTKSPCNEDIQIKGITEHAGTTANRRAKISYQIKKRVICTDRQAFYSTWRKDGEE